MQIVWTKKVEEATRLAEAGFEPVECSFGAVSVVGSLIMDHHGEYAELEGVALRAYRDHFGARQSDPRFVVTGAADADACFAIAALAGMLPHPSHETELASAAPSVKASGTRNLTGLAELVNRVDTAPIGVRLEESEEGALILLWNQLSSSVHDATAFYAGLDRWRALLGRTPKALIQATKNEEETRVAKAREARVVRISDQVAVVESPVWGFDVWYAEVAPVIVAYVATSGTITLGCPSTEVAETLFGLGGMKNVFPKLTPAGWGGREAIGGSPRGQKLTREQALEAANVTAEALL